MPHIRSFDDCRIMVEDSGSQSAPVLMLAHHLGGDLTIWDTLVAAMRNTFRIVRFDTRGQGRSDAPDGPYDITMLGRDALAVMDALQISRVNFVGLSQGGMIGMWLAVNHPEKIERLVLANSTPFIPNKVLWDDLIAQAKRSGMEKIAEKTMDNWLCASFRSHRPSIVRSLVQLMIATPAVGFAANCAVLRDIDLRDRLGEITCPTLVIGGAEDGPRGASAPLMASTIPDCRLVMIEEAAHLTAIENPADFNHCVEEFLA